MLRPIALLLALFLGVTAAPAAEHVVLVSIDGFAAYHLLNQELELPNIRGLIRNGAWATASETVFPSVTHPSHTTMVTGVDPRVHGVLSNGLRNRETGESFHPTNKPRTEIVKIPTIFDAVKKQKGATAAFFWPETLEDPSIDFNVPEVFTPEHKGDITAVPAAVLDELRTADVPIDLYFRWYGSERQTAGDLILAESAAYALKTYKPALLAIHILATDEAQHTYGPHHFESSAAIENADAAVGVLIEGAKAAGIDDQTTFIVGADHGFHSVYHEMNILGPFEEAGLTDKLQIRGGGWTQSITLGDKFDPKRDQATLDAVLAKLVEHERIERVVRPGEFHAIGLPEYDESVYAFGHYLILPDADTFLVARKGEPSLERRLKETPSHGHGYLPDHPRMRPSLVLAGAGIKKGVRLGLTRNHDIAPTIAHLLGVSLSVEPTGRVLGEALE